ncbi:MAG: DinB family protein [Dehalococcoidia bacterium]
MSTVQFIQRSMDFAHRALADARNGTEDQLHFVPPNGSHSIAWCLWHTARIEDLIIGARVLGQKPIWNDDWAKRTGLPPEGTGNGLSDEDSQKIRITDIGAFADYQQAVWDQTARYLEGATDEDLEREVPAREGTETVGEAISLHLMGHFNGHRGEINTLRGMQGMPTVLQREGTH